MTRPEILAPAGSWETLKAAAAAGADAVYFGGQQFNARRNAGNFTDEEMAEAIGYCHARGIRAYITLNTIVFETEVKKALDFLQLLCCAGADAVILQDLGLLRLIKKAAPTMRLHASTQMSAINLAGVTQLAAIGFSRVVVARELSKAEIEYILKNSPVELEVFVHGALCMSISGQCYMSAMLGGRSGNRGLCAQPCRLPFSVVGGTGNDLSLHDLSLVTKIDELSEMGVSSLKIEGRMKRPEYVAAATNLCKRAVDGEKVSQEELGLLQDVFSRGGFTQGYYEEKLGRDMFGARGREDVLATQAAIGAFRSLYEGVERPRIAVDYSFTAKNGEKTRLIASDDDGYSAQIDGIVPEPARTKAIDEELIKEKLSKTGGTPFYLRTLRVDIGHSLSIPVAEINHLRRETLDLLYKKRSLPCTKVFIAPEVSTVCEKAVENRGLRIRLQSIIQMTQAVINSGAELTFLPIGEIIKNSDEIKNLIAAGINIGAELPRAIFYDDSVVEKSLNELKLSAVRDILCGNLGSVFIAKKCGFLPHGDFGLNIANGFALDELLYIGAESVIISFEGTLSEIRLAAHHDAHMSGLIAYGRLPLMLTRNCPLKNGEGCIGCVDGETGSITDRRGGHFPIICTGGASELLNNRPIWMCDRKDELYRTGVSFAQLNFTIESPEQTDTVLNAWQLGTQPVGDFTRGLYYRGVE